MKDRLLPRSPRSRQLDDNQLQVSQRQQHERNAFKVRKHQQHDRNAFKVRKHQQHDCNAFEVRKHKQHDCNTFKGRFHPESDDCTQPRKLFGFFQYPHQDSHPFRIGEHVQPRSHEQYLWQPRSLDILEYVRQQGCGCQRCAHQQKIIKPS